MRIKRRLHKSTRYVCMGLPLVAIISLSFLPLQRTGQQLLILGAFVWFQFFILLEVFMTGS